MSGQPPEELSTLLVPVGWSDQFSNTVGLFDAWLRLVFDSVRRPSAAGLPDIQKLLQWIGLEIPGQSELRDNYAAHTGLIEKYTAQLNGLDLRTQQGVVKVGG